MTEKSCTEQRESYWDYMGRRLREDKSNSGLVFPSQTALYTDDMCKKEIAEMQKQVHVLQMSIVKLSEEVYRLRYTIQIMGGDSTQMELQF